MRARLLIAFIGFCARLPLAWSHALGAVLGRVAWWLPTKARRVSLLNLRACLPELTASQRRQMARKSLVETGKTITELGAAWCWPVTRMRERIIEIVNEDLVDEAERRGKGIIFLIPHLGAWEVANHYYPARGRELTCLYRPPALAGLDQFIRHARERCGTQLVPTDLSGVKALLRALKNNQAIGILPDQHPGTGQGVVAPFFKTPALTMTLVNRLVAKSGATPLMAYAERLPKGRGYRMVFAPASAQLADADPVVAATALNTDVEQCVRQLPQQYQWSYKRFKYQAPGQPPFYG